MPNDRRPPHRRRPIKVGDDEPLVDPGRGLGLPLRLLALRGALSFVMLGISSIATLLQPPPPPEMPDQHREPPG
jgi:hypothetical protein